MRRPQRLMNKLSAAKVPALLEKKKGQWGDGAGLWLIVASPAAASWLFRYTLKRKAKVIGLGSARSISLAEARTKAAAARELLDAGIDPQAQQPASPEAARVPEEVTETKVKTKTFRECAKAYIDAHRPGWKNEKHAEQWPSSLEEFVYPMIGDLDVGAVNTDHVSSIIEPIWRTKVETANRVRGRIEAVLSWATSREYRQGDNPARWRGHFENLLPPRSKIRRVKHHASMPYERVGGFVRELQKNGSVGCRALEFLILCASRTGEVRGADWGEFDLTAGVWTLPGERMKAGVMHRIPLSGRALEILDGQKRLTGGVGFVFPGQRSEQPLSPQVLLSVMERMKRDEFTPHGFRSSFRVWCAEKTTFPSAVCEAALAHTNRNTIEATYQTSDLFKRRGKLMRMWSAYLAAPEMISKGPWAKYLAEPEDDEDDEEGEVIPIRPAAAA